MDSELSDLLEALILHRERLDALDEKTSLITDEINNFQTEYAKDKEQINLKIDDILGQIQRLILEAVAKLPKPKDGIDFDHTIANTLISAKVNTLIKQKDRDIESIKSELQTFIIQESKRWKPDERQIESLIKSYFIANKSELRGDNGNDAEPIQFSEIQKAVTSYINNNKDMFEAKDGQDGVGIEDITQKDNVITITLTNGATKTITLPRQQKVIGGGGVSLYAVHSAIEERAYLEKIVKTIESITLVPKTQTVLVDASSGNIDITLPDPLNSYPFDMSIKIAVSRIDTSSNLVNILPNGSETILNEASQNLITGEVINLITDNQNWWYGA